MLKPVIVNYHWLLSYYLLIFMTQPQYRSLRIQGIAFVLVLMAQYILGMYANLYIRFPIGLSGAQMWHFALHQWVLVLHILLGISLPIGSVVFFTKVLHYRSTTWKIPAIGGICGMWIASAAGVFFLSLQLDGYSFIMSLAFIVALFSYMWGVIASASEKLAA